MTEWDVGAVGDPAAVCWVDLARGFDEDLLYVTPAEVGIGF